MRMMMSLAHGRQGTTYLVEEPITAYKGWHLEATGVGLFVLRLYR